MQVRTDAMLIAISPKSIGQGIKTTHKPLYSTVNYNMLWDFVCVEVLPPSQPNGSWPAWSVYLTTRLLGLQAVNQYCAHSFARN